MTPTPTPVRNAHADHLARVARLRAHYPDARVSRGWSRLLNCGRYGWHATYADGSELFLGATVERALAAAEVAP